MATGRNPGWNPTRRNRNIGTENSGYKEQSVYLVPERYNNWRPFYEDLKDYVVVSRRVQGTELRFLIEPTRGEHIHVCTPDDVARMLNLLPGHCIKGPEPLRGVIMRQPTHKQSNLAGVWGRMCYYTEIGPVKGAVMHIDAAVPWWYRSFSRKMSLEAQGEFERSRRLMSEPELHGRSHRFEMGFLNLRRWLLYHTLLHEIGHWMDYRHRVLVPGMDGGDADQLWERYAQRPVAEREAFAHRFSDEWRDELVHRGEIPFEHQFDGERLEADGVDPVWFLPPSDEAGEAGPPIGLMFPQRREPMFAKQAPGSSKA